MSEKELNKESTRVIRESAAMAEAIERLRTLLRAELGEIEISMVHGDRQDSVFRDPKVMSFLESRAFPFRGVYTAPVGASAMLVACVGSWGAPLHYVQRLINGISDQLSAPPFKTNLIENRAA